MSGLFGGGGSSKSKRPAGYVPPAGQVPEPEPDTRFPAPGAVPVKSTPVMSGLDAFGGSSLAGEATKSSNSWG